MFHRWGVPHVDDVGETKTGWGERARMSKMHEKEKSAAIVFRPKAWHSNSRGQSPPPADVAPGQTPSSTNSRLKALHQTVVRPLQGRVGNAAPHPGATLRSAPDYYSICPSGKGPSARLHPFSACSIQFCRRLGCVQTFLLVLSAASPAMAGAHAGVATSQPATPAVRVLVDPRVELLSLVFRLAGKREYSKCNVPAYAEDVEKHFGSFRSHPVVRLAKCLPDGHCIGYDAVMSMAVHITDTESLRERVPFDPFPKTLDGRWRTATARLFLKQLRAFVKESDFNAFVRAHQPLYTETASRVQSLLKTSAHLEWFESFFGPRKGSSFVLAIGLLNGGGNYGASCRDANGEEVYCILGVWFADTQGMPYFDRIYLPVIIHEFTHTYTNPVVDAHLPALRSAGETLYPYVARQMEAQAYSAWETMMRESLVRACVLRYQLKYERGWGALQMLDERMRSFLWIDGLFQRLGEYEADRAKYPTLDAFMPRVVDFFDEYARKFVAEQAAKAGTKPAGETSSRPAR